MQDDIFEILRKQELAITAEKVYYVYYVPVSGEIVHFRNYFENDSYPFIEVKESEFEEPIEKFKMRNYRVLEKNSKMKMVKIPSPFELILKDSDLIYRVPKFDKNKKNTEEPEIYIEQNNSKKIFRISLLGSKRVKLQDLENLHQSIHMYVTEEGDPNILYKTLTFNLSDICKSEYKDIPFGDFKGGSCNIYLTKYFQSYLHMEVK